MTRLSDLTYELYFKYEGNPRTILTITNTKIREEFSHEYEGKRAFFGGVNGRLGDIPAYLGNCIVNYYTIKKDNDGVIIEIVL